jgi:NitT/TauT family transport system ATP-binding protein
MAIIRFKDVQRVFHQNGKDFVALKGIDLEVRDREFVAIVGPSGCGKTTPAHGRRSRASHGGSVSVDGVESRRPARTAPWCSRHSRCSPGRR